MAETTTESKEERMRRLRRKFTVPEMLREDGSLNSEYVLFHDACIFSDNAQVFSSKEPKAYENAQMDRKRTRAAEHRYERIALLATDCVRRHRKVWHRRVAFHQRRVSARLGTRKGRRKRIVFSLRNVTLQEESELRVKTARLMGRQSLLRYKNWKGDAQAIAREYGVLFLVRSVGG